MMLDTCFYFLVNMSISGSVVIAILLLVRGIRIIPRRWLYPLWSIALLRLLVPVALTSSISVFNGFRDLLELWAPAKTVVLAEVRLKDIAHNTGGSVRNNQNEEEDRSNSGDYRIGLTAMNAGYSLRTAEGSVEDNTVGSQYLSAADISRHYFPVQYKTQGLAGIFHTSTNIWSAGAVVLFFAVWIMYFALRRQFKYPGKFRDGVYVDPAVTSPFLLGIIKPRIMLPEDLDPDSTQMSHIIAHEKVHIKRGDNLWRLAGLLVSCLHWFNPVVWLGYSCFLKDMEFSCDEIAVKHYSSGRRREYAEALLTIAERPQGQNPLPAGFGKTSTGTRITSVLTNQKLSWFGTAISIMFILVIALMLITNARI